ncbi:hypothetical protein LIER_24472 [Lithospermum erythrorhizon]|uniref:Uncharacterized protein n=1 Tax=Lithospermum erythrorhizon TaxID=34254 RepID=A0AAV3R4G0_LITER
MVGVDHCPILLDTELKTEKSKRSFGFDSRWVGKEGCEEGIFSSNSVCHPQKATQSVDHRVTKEMNLQLTRVVTSEEDKRAVFEMPVEKSPEPDGMTVLFFQSFWHIVSSDIVKGADSFFFSSKLLHYVNHTHVCLIPKKTAPMSMSDFRPISLCNIVP